MKRFLWGSLLVFLLAACSTNNPELPQATDTFNFTVDPAAQTVESVPALVSELSAQAETGSRILVPGKDLSLETYTFAFLPGNLLAIDATFKNISNQTFTNLAFSRAASSSDVVSSTEPTVADTSLEPGESTGTLRFMVQHRGQRFTYEVEARATVEEPGGNDCTDPVVIPDRFLREGIRIQLQIPAGDEITCADMERLTEFRYNAEDDFIATLEGLQYAVNLTVLELLNNVLTDISQVSGLTKLTRLDLGSNGQLSDITPLSGLVNLEYLGLARNAIEDISPLSNLINLEQLFLGGNDNINLEPLSGLPNLRELYLNNTAALKDYSVLQDLPNLQVLDLSNRFFVEEDSKIVDVSFLKGLTGLTQLDLSDNKISDISSLSGLVNLSELDLESNQVSNIDSLSGLENLSQLNLSLNFIRDLTPLVENAGLGNDEDRIGLSGNCLDTSQGSQALIDVDTIESRNPDFPNVVLGTQKNHAACGQQPPPPPPAEECTDPVNIPDDILRQSIRDALNKPEGDITCADLASLTELVSQIDTDVDIEVISNLEGIQFAKNLEALTFYAPGNERIRAPDYLKPLSSLINLTSLRIFNTRDFVDDDYGDLDFSPLSGLFNLTLLSLPATQVSNIDFLSGLTNLSNLNLADNIIDDYSPLSNLTALKKLNLSSYNLYSEIPKIDDIGFLSSLTGLTDLDLTNNEVSDLSPLSGLTELANLDLSSNRISNINPLVTNAGAGDDDDWIDLRKNCFSATPGSEALQSIETIEARNPDVQNVFFDSQADARCNP